MTVVGVIGGGQLGLMLGIAARQLDVECIFMDPNPAAPAASAGAMLNCDFDDPDGLAELAARAHVITYEFENVPVDALSKMPTEVRVFPPPEALRIAQDRLLEKRLFKSLHIPTPEFHNVESIEDLTAAATDLGFPFVLKTRRLGYDGKGQAVIGDQNALEAAWAELGAVPLIAEAWVEFDCEVSAIGARTATGNTVCYPLTENRHRDGILRSSLAPAGSEAQTTLATQYHSRLMGGSGTWASWRWSYSSSGIDCWRMKSPHGSIIPGTGLSRAR